MLADVRGQREFVGKVINSEGKFIKRNRAHSV
jgi:hypothetical protein